VVGHTPGPWYWDGDCLTSKSGGLLSLEGGYTWYGRDGDYNLISKAPEMFELLNTIFVHLTECSRHGKYEWTVNDLRAIKKLIKEVEGNE